MIGCTSAAYRDRTTALAARREIIRHYRVNAGIMYCARCDKYHVNANLPRSPLNERYIQILQLLAAGYRGRETAEMIGMTERSVEDVIQNLMRRFYALSRVNLVAIMIALGVIHPNSFVPFEENHQHVDDITRNI